MQTIVVILLALVHEVVLSRATLQLENIAQPDGTEKIVAFPQVGGLHHRYERLAA